MNNNRAIEVLQQILIQFEISLSYAEMEDDDAIESKDDNLEAKLALEMAIKALKSRNECGFDFNNGYHKGRDIEYQKGYADGYASGIIEPV